MLLNLESFAQAFYQTEGVPRRLGMSPSCTSLGEQFSRRRGTEGRVQFLNLDWDLDLVGGLQVLIPQL